MVQLFQNVLVINLLDTFNLNIFRLSLSEHYLNSLSWPSLYKFSYSSRVKFQAEKWKKKHESLFSHPFPPMSVSTDFQSSWQRSEVCSPKPRTDAQKKGVQIDRSGITHHRNAMIDFPALEFQLRHWWRWPSHFSLSQPLSTEKVKRI